MIGATDRVREYLKFKEVSKYAFYKETGFSNKFLDNSSNMGTNKAEIILRYYPDLNPVWLITGKGEMIIKEKNQDLQTFNLSTDHNQENQIIPLYSLEATAGLVELFRNQSDNTPIDTLSIPNLPKCDGALYVTGDSMYPLLKSGDIVIYKQIEDFRNDIFWGEMYIISVEVGDEEYISVKYVQKSDEGTEWIKLVSRNTHHQSKNVHLGRVRAMALVKASVRINAM